MYGLGLVSSTPPTPPAPSTCPTGYISLLGQCVVPAPRHSATIVVSSDGIVSGPDSVLDELMKAIEAPLFFGVPDWMWLGGASVAVFMFMGKGQTWPIAESESSSFGAQSGWGLGTSMKLTSRVRRLRRCHLQRLQAAELRWLRDQHRVELPGDQVRLRELAARHLRRVR